MEVTKPEEESTEPSAESVVESQKQVRKEVEEEPEEVPRVCVVGVETRARAEGGVEWRPPPSPTLGLPHSRPTTPLPPEPEPHNIFLEGSLPSHSQLLVEDAATELLDPTATDPAVILSGKMTLSLISINEDLKRLKQPVPNPGQKPADLLFCCSHDSHQRAFGRGGPTARRGSRTV